jgi:hypothetical protein
VPGTNAFVSTSTHPNPLFTGSSVSYDAGQTWTDIERNAPKAACRFFDANTGYAGSFYVTGHPIFGVGGLYKSEIVFQIPSPQNRNGSITKSTIQPEKNLTDALVKVYPTPANNVLNISLPDALANTVNVVSLVSTDGKIIETRRTEASNLLQLDVSKLIPGMYIVRIQSNTQIISKAITIKR